IANHILFKSIRASPTSKANFPIPKPIAVKDEINKNDNDVVEKTAKMDHVDGTFESSLETGIDVVKEIPWNHQKPTGMDKQSDLESCSQSGMSICKSEGTAFELDLEPIGSGSLDNLKSIIENKLENNGTWFENRLEESTVQIKESINKGIKTGKNYDVAIAWFGYLPMNWPFTPIFDPGGCFHFAFKLKQPIVGVGSQAEETIVE
ncbi:14999_t:CDS:2, partial [Gigaspora margarita]